MIRLRRLVPLLAFAACALSPLGAITAPAHKAYASAELLKDMASKPAHATYGAFLHFSKGSKAEQNAVIARLGLAIHSDFRKYTDSVYVTGPVPSFYAAMTESSIYYIEYNAPLTLEGDTGPWATRARVAQEPVGGGPYTDGMGRVLTGEGVGVAVVDSGVNAVHPDFASNIARNYKIECPLVAPPGAADSGCVFRDVGTTASTDVGGGHGTHVSGIVAGAGTASVPTHGTGAKPNVEGSFTGVAPKAKLYVFSTGEGLNILYSVQAITYILDHYDEFTPRIRVTNHSYGQNLNTNPADAGAETTPYNGNDTERQLAVRLVAKGTLMSYSAGNNGPGNAGAGNLRRTNVACQTPYNGVMCTANYDDAGTGNQDNALDTSSSRGKKGFPNTYPDLASPGANITSTCGAGAGAICQSGDTRWGSMYGTISGTSMASPHTAGAAALLFQARPELTPAQVQNILKSTARKVTFEGAYETETAENNPGGNPGGTHNFAVGAGLLDIPAALDFLGVTHPGVPATTTAPAEYVLIAADADATAAGAADVVGLSEQETARGASTSGINFRISLRDATAFGQTPSIGYTLSYNVGGNHFDTRVDATSAAVTIAGGGTGNNAPAAQASRTGNVITVFVPHSRIGNPAIGTPVHNVSVRSFSTSDNSTLDTAPSKAGSTPTQADTEPAFGRPFTILRPATAGAVASLESACTAPGLTQLEDPQGDIFALNDAAPSNNNTPAYDIRKLSITQPYVTTTNDYKVEIYLKMQALNPLPVGNWPVNFCSPKFKCVNPDTNTEPYAKDTNQYYTVRMTSDSSVAAGATPAAPIFQLLSPNATSTSTGTRTIKVLTGNGSNFAATGLIKFVVNASDLGLDASKAGIETLSKFQSRVSGAGTPTPDNMPDGLAGQGEYRSLPLTQCDPANVAPVAILGASTNSGSAPLSVSFTVNATDPGDSIGSYALDFGDDASISGNNPTLPLTVTHSYRENGDYTARLTVVDSHQKASNVATQAIAVIVEPVNVKPTAALAATPTTGHGPLMVNLSGAGSTDSDGSIVEYRFSFGDGTADVKQPGATLMHSYARVGTYNATLTVLDNKGAVSTAAVSPTITVTNTAPIARLSATPASGSAPLSVTLSGAASSDPDSDAISNYHFECGNGVVRDVATNSTSCVYEAAGRYTAKLAVTDSLGSVSATVEQIIDVAQGTANQLQPFSFIERRDVKTNTFITSEAVKPSGFTGSLPISVTAGLQYSINGGPFTAEPGSFPAGATLAVRHVSASTEGTAKEGTVTLGSGSEAVAAVFRTVTTTLDHVPDAFDFGSSSNNTANTLVEPPVRTLVNYDDAPIVPGPGVSYRINGGSWTSARGTLVKGQTLQLRHTSNSASLGYTKSYVTVGGVRGNFTTRTAK